MKTLRFYSLSFFFLIVFSIATLTGCGKKADINLDSEPVQLTSKVSQSSAAVGDEIRFTLELHYRKEVTPAPTLPDVGSEIKGFRIVRPEIKGPKPVGNELILSREYILACDLEGSYVLPSVEVSYETDSGLEKVSSARIFVEVGKVLEQDSDMKDILGIDEPKEKRFVRSYAGWFWLAGILVLLFGIWYGRRFFSDTYEERLIPAHEWAEQQLDALLRKKYSQSGEFRLLYHGLSKILRGYLNRRFAITAEESTTQEMEKTLSSVQEISSDQRMSLMDFFIKADQVRFAGIPTDPEQCDACANFIREFVSETHMEEQEGADELE